MTSTKQKGTACQKACKGSAHGGRRRAVNNAPIHSGQTAGHKLLALEKFQAIKNPRLFRHLFLIRYRQQ